MTAETQSVTRAKPGERPGGTIETAGYMTARVENIDYQSQRITLKMPHGDTMSLKAGDQVKRLNEIKKGDKIVVYPGSGDLCAYTVVLTCHIY